MRLLPWGKARVETPERIRLFLESTRDLGWGASDVRSSVQALFLALDELTQAEIAYYYRQRGRKALVSSICRFMAWVLGTLGLLAPLVGAAYGTGAESLGKWGYVLLAASASAIAANTLFGGTADHIRYVSAQLELERLITAFRVQWARIRAETEGAGSTEQVTKSFNAMESFVAEMYKLLLAETGSWGTALQAAIQDFAKQARASK